MKGPSFRMCDPDQTHILPPNLNDWLPRNHLAQIVVRVVGEDLELAPYAN